MNEDIYYAIKDWLAEHGYTEGDIMVDEDGEQFVISEDENGEQTILYLLDEINAE